MGLSTRTRAAGGFLALLTLTACTASQSAGPSLDPGTSVPGSPSASPAGSIVRPSPSPTPAEPSPSPSPSPPPPTWTPLTPAGEAPGAREDHTWTIDPDTGRAFLFGGRRGTKALADLWAYDLASDSWRRLRPDGDAPTARFGHEAAWVPHVGLVIFAGQAGSTFFSDLWAFDPAADNWTKLPGRGERPVSRYGTCSAIGPDGRLWISHGFTSEGARFADTRAYDFAAGRWTDVTPTGRVPVERCLHGCFWSDYARFVLYAGQTTGAPALGDLWSFGRDESWQKADSGVLPARNLYAYASHAGDWIVFGGQADDRGYLDDLWRLDGEALTFSEITTVGKVAPAARSGAALIDDRDRGRLLLFGGKDGDGERDDLWALTGLP